MQIGSHYVARFLRETKRNLFCEGHHPIENEDVLGLVVGSWAYLEFFQLLTPGLGTDLLQ